MDVLVLREKLHDYINSADEQHLSAIYVLVEDNIRQTDNEIYDESTMNMIYQRRENHRQGLSKSYSAEESLNLIRQHKK